MRIRCRQTAKPVVKKQGGKGSRHEKNVGRQMLQLIVCVVLFFTVYIGKGAFPERVAQVGPQLLGVIRSNTDFRAVFHRLGSVMTDSERLPDGLKEFCVAVFGVGAGSDGDTSTTGQESVEVLQPETLAQDEPAQQTEPEPPVPQYKVGDVVETIAVNGQALPKAYTYNHLYLGDMKTADPVEGRLTSPFGYRVHPTIGTYAVHGGVDIGAARGSAVRAFADGTVEFVGENDDFGLYLQLKHENDVSTFYSHCQSIGVKKGEQVHAGQAIAKVGSTGKSTGPHLHFEIRLGDVRLDPMHYVALQEE